MLLSQYSIMTERKLHITMLHRPRGKESTEIRITQKQAKKEEILAEKN